MFQGGPAYPGRFYGNYLERMLSVNLKQNGRSAKFMNQKICYIS